MAAEGGVTHYYPGHLMGDRWHPSLLVPTARVSSALDS